MAEIIKMGGTVRSVNNAEPDENGNVNVEIPSALIAYPVGSIYMSVNSTNPKDLFGGTWAQLAPGRLLMGAGSSSYSAGSTGGSATKTLTVSNLPSHNHTITVDDKTLSHKHKNGICDDQTAGTGPISRNYGATTVTTTGAQSTVMRDGDQVMSGASVYMGYTSTDETTHNHTASSAKVGNGTAFNILPPYLVVYMWKRTA